MVANTYINENKEILLTEVRDGVVLQTNTFIATKKQIAQITLMNNFLNLLLHFNQIGVVSLKFGNHGNRGNILECILEGSFGFDDTKNQNEYKYLCISIKASLLVDIKVSTDSIKFTKVHDYGFLK